MQHRRESLPAIHQAVRRRLSGPLLLPPIWRRHSCQENPNDTWRGSGANTLPLGQLEALYSRALASRDENRSAKHICLFLILLCFLAHVGIHIVTSTQNKSSCFLSFGSYASIILVAVGITPIETKSLMSPDKTRSKSSIWLDEIWVWCLKNVNLLLGGQCILGVNP